MTDAVRERNELVEKNLGLVHSCANRFRGRGVEYDDLFQAGCLGLIKAANNFDVTLGFSFSTYAVPVILGEIRRIFRDGGSVKVGRTMKERAREMLREKEELSQLLDREPTVSELAERMNTDAVTVSQLLNAVMPAVSLTADSDGAGNEFDIPVDSPQEALADSIALGEVINSLEERDREMITLRYYHGLTQVKTAQKLGMSQVQVSRREKSVLAEIRRKFLL
ncbi:MAG: sigma-70 family RNA polymerase sigma factor [Clostridia bacterium]|nr:sigma-70 family RNA polymerase sigma factor [Clostridia bacterium]